MKGHTRIIRVNGTIEEQDHTKMPDLEFWRAAVGGSIELIPQWPNGVAFCDEEGKLKGKQINWTANAQWKQQGDILVGDIVEVTGDREFMQRL